MENKSFKVVFAIFILFIFNVLPGISQLAPPWGRGGIAVDKSKDAGLEALISGNLDKFIQQEYVDTVTGHTMHYNLHIPADYDPGISYPLLLFIADASTANKETTAPLTQGYGGLVWVTDRDQARHPSFALVPQYVNRTVNDEWETSYEVEMTIRLLGNITRQYSIDFNRLYITGQSMGGMMSMYFNIAHPDLFAASLFVGCQWDTTKMAPFSHGKFFYIVGAGDPKASKGMAGLKTILHSEGARFGTAEWSAKLPATEQEAEAQKLISEGNNINFITFTLGSVLPENGGGNEHMSSFDYAYKLEAVRDWLFQQSR